MRATKLCPHCKKPAEVKSEKRIESLHKIRITFNCGHTILEKLTKIPQGRDEKWNDFFEFQKTGIEAIEQSNYRILVADECGLGKTIQYQGALRYNWVNLTPCLIICKASLIFNHMREYMKWVADSNESLSGRLDYLPIPVMDGQNKPLPGFRVYIVSMDIISKPKIMAWISETPFKTMVIDESHNFKNISSKRTCALNTCTKHIPNRICLSGTPILNNTLEYFPTLNIIRPEVFYSQTRFIQDYIEYDRETKRWLGLKKWKRDEFFRLTSSYIIRREKKDVLKDLPPMRINEQVISNFDRAFATAYNVELDKLEALLNAEKSSFQEKSQYMDILAAMSRLRHITGLAKVQAAFEYAEEFLESTSEGSKLCIGIHHKDVAQWLQVLLSKYNPVMISGADSPEEKQRKEDLFRTTSRLAIVNTLSVGEGRNFQFCANALVVEQQWNQKKEDQFTGRFQRPIKCEKCDAPFIKITPEDGVPYYKCPKCNNTTDIVPIQIDYLLAANTIDEFFSKLKQLKQQVTDSSMSWSFETDYTSIYRLAQEVVMARMKAGI
jgi:SNF2 family DNA or RNA helicase